MFKRKKDLETGSDKPDPAMFGILRGKLLDGSPREFGVAPSDRYPRVWAALMEIGMSGSIASTASIVDGSTSLYLGTGGGVIGGGTHEAVANATYRFLDLVEASLARLDPTDSLPLPDEGEVRFNVLGYDGLRVTTSGIEAEIWESEAHPLRPLYAAGQDIVTELRPWMPPQS